MNGPKLIASSCSCARIGPDGLYKGERQSLNWCGPDHSMLASYRVH